MDGRQKMKLNVLRKRRHHHKKQIKENKNYMYGKPGFNAGLSTVSLDSSRILGVPPVNYFSKSSVEVLVESDGKKTNDLENPSTSAVKNADKTEANSVEEIEAAEPNDGYLEKSDDNIDGQSNKKKSPSKLDNRKDLENTEDEDSLVIRCLNFTCQCCECNIL